MAEFLIIVDVGNSLTKYSLFSGGEIKKTLQFPTIPTKTSENYRQELALLPANNIKGVIYGSVVPQVDMQLQSLLSNKYSQKPFIIKTDPHAKLTKSLGSPAQLGSDLFGFATYLADDNQINCGIIYGTAIVALLVSKGVITKVAIFPGVSLAFNALLKKAAKLSTWGKFITPPPHFGSSTITALQAGRYHYYQGITNQIISSWQNSKTFDNVILSGGDLPNFETTNFKTIPVKNAVSLGYAQIFQKSQLAKG